MAEIVVKLVNAELAGKSAQSLNKEYAAAALAVKKAEVGTKAWIDAHAKLDKVKGLQADLRKQVESTAAASDLLKAAWNKLPGAQFFNSISQSFGLLRSGVGGLVNQFGILKVAIASTGIGLLVLLLGSLVTWFSKTEEGSDKLKSVLYPLQVLFQAITGVVANLGGKVFKRLEEAFKNPTQAIKDLGQAILDNIINRFKAISVLGEGIALLFQGKWSAAAKSLTNGFVQLTTGVTDFTDKAQEAGNALGELWDKSKEQGKQLLDLENAIEDAEIALTKSRAKLNVQLSEQMAIARDVTKSDLQRLDAAKKAMEIQDQLSAQEERFLQLKLKRLKIEQDQDGIMTDPERLERAKAEAEIIQLQADNIDKKKKASALFHSLELEIQKQSEAEWKKYYDTLNELDKMHIDAMEDGREKDLASLQLSLQSEIEALDSNAPFYAETLAAKQELARQKRKEINDKWDKQDETDLKAKNAKEIAEIETHLNHANFLLLKQLSEGNISRRQFDKLAEDNRKIAYQEQLAALEEQGLKETAEYEAIAAKIIDIEQQKQDKIKAGREATFNATVNFGQALLQSQIDNINRENSAGEARLAEIEKRQGKESAAYKIAQNQLLKTQRDNFEKKKKLEKSQIKINALAEIASIIKSAVEIGGVYGIIVGALLAAATTIRANSAIQEVNAQQFKFGGIPDGVLKGPSHAEGGIPLVAEGQEIILTKGVYNNPKLRSMASAINVAGGGRQFAAGGPTNPFSDSSRGPVSSGNASPSQGGDNSRLEAYLMQNFEAINNRIDKIQVINVMTKPDGTGYKDQIDTVNKIQSNADV